MPREYVLGIDVLRADGERVKAGGRVVKNVTGYDLMRLNCGALGTLGIIERVALGCCPDRNSGSAGAGERHRRGRGDRARSDADRPGRRSQTRLWGTRGPASAGCRQRRNGRPVRRWGAVRLTERQRTISWRATQAFGVRTTLRVAAMPAMRRKWPPL